MAPLALISAQADTRLWILGFSATFAIVCLLLVMRRRRRLASQRSTLSASAPQPISFPQPLASDSTTSGKQIVRLSSSSAPTPTAQMTQQQRIAAALEKAGLPNHANWTPAEPDGNESD